MATRFALLLGSGAAGAVMNEGGVPYQIGNGAPGPAGAYAADFRGLGDFFEVYGEVRTRYSQVYWTRNPPVALPRDIVERFDGKVMAITGYEVDQVIRTPEGDKSIPMYHAYNHHYFGWIVGKDAEMVKLDEPQFLPNPTWWEARTKGTVDHDFPTSIVFKENPGGEYRKSYHGYPRGFAQLVHSPKDFVLEPMQIDTHNRAWSPSATNESGYQPWFLPKAVEGKYDPSSGLSPLIECPCSDRITKEVGPDGKKYLVYMNKTRQEYQVDCEPTPRGEMLAQHNPACHAESYHGGVYCCRHLMFMTDIGQAHLVPDAEDVYYLKWRFYFQDYAPATATALASHAHLHHWVFLIDASVNDYEEVKCADGTLCEGSITAHVTAAQMGLEDVPAKFSGVTPLVIAAHCHAPSCLRQELYNADTGDLICRVEAQYGRSAGVFDEANYIALPPCLFGYEPGLRPPLTFAPSTNLRAIKVFNNTVRHTGQMAQWTGLMVYEGADWPAAAPPPRDPPGAAGVRRPDFFV